VFDVFLPIEHLWQIVFENNLAAVLNFIYAHFQAVPILATIGAYGLAIIVLTIGIRLVLAPLQQFQLRTQRKSMLEQRKLAPQVAELRKKFKKDAPRLNSEMQKLYQEHGVNPLAGLIGCLPLIVQLPILTALYYVFRLFAQHATVAAHFLFIPNLNLNPNHQLLFTFPGSSIGIPTIAYLVFPLLAAGTTFVQTKMLQMPQAPNPTEQEQQTQQMQKMMVWMSPLMIGYFALNVPAGLGLYWFIGNCVGIIQQYFVVGWGNLLPGRLAPGAGTAVDARGVGGPKNVPGGGPKNVPSTGPRNVPGSGPKNVPGTGTKNVPGSGPKAGPARGPRNGPENGPPGGRNRRKPKR
jgi:YidC/Oxa1 family membrane protein insertase